MRLRLLTITQKTPAWLKIAYEDYVKRLNPISLELIEIPAEKRAHHSNIQILLEKEGERIFKFVKPHHRLIALDVQGESWSTIKLSEHIQKWQLNSENIDFIIGGPDGLSPACLNRAHIKWSLSPLTFPHFFVRLIVIEQIYRAFSILAGHPYHR